MQYVIGTGEDIRVIEIPDEARAITDADRAVLAQKAELEEQKRQEYNERLVAAEKKRAIEVRIAELKRNLNRTDYQAIKFAEGEMSAVEYAAVKAERSAWRAEINALEAELCNMS